MYAYLCMWMFIFLVSFYLPIYIFLHAPLSPSLRAHLCANGWGYTRHRRQPANAGRSVSARKTALSVRFLDISILRCHFGCMFRYRY